MLGFKVIKEMTKAEMIEELLAGQRALMDTMDEDVLKRYIINHRTAQVTNRLVAEADLKDGPWPIGILSMGSDG